MRETPTDEWGRTARSGNKAIDDPKERMMERLRKLLEVQNRAATEAEAQQAATLLQRFLTEHNLSVADLERRGQTAPQMAEGQHDLGKAAWKWKLDLAEGIAEFYYCAPLVDRRTKTGSIRWQAGQRGGADHAVRVGVRPDQAGGHIRAAQSLRIHRGAHRPAAVADQLRGGCRGTHHCSFKGAVKLEMVGIKMRRGQTIWKQAAREYGIKGNREKVYKWLCAKVEEMRPLQEHVSTVNGREIREVEGKEVQ